MVTTFNTSSPTTGGNEKGGSNTLLIVLGIAVAGFLVYRFVIKPRMDKTKQEKKEQ